MAKNVCCGQTVFRLIFELMCILLIIGGIFGIFGSGFLGMSIGILCIVGGVFGFVCCWCKLGSCFWLVFLICAVILLIAEVLSFSINFLQIACLDPKTIANLIVIWTVGCQGRGPGGCVPLNGTIAAIIIIIFLVVLIVLGFLIKTGRHKKCC